MAPASYRRTTIACFTGIFVQAIVTNLTAILFVPLMGLYGLQYGQLGILVGVNFTAQVSADILFSGAIDRFGYRRIILPASLTAGLGLVLFALTPWLFPGREFSGMLLATVLFSFAAGLHEIMLSPIIAAIPSADKSLAMSLMHSFYAWGQVATIILTTLFLFLVPYRFWPFIVLFWALVPLLDFLLFVGSPFPDVVAVEHRLNMKDLLFQPFYLLALLAIFAGAGAEIVMNQWASTFAEVALSLPKLTGDLLGMCLFAAMIGVGRLLHGRFGSGVNMNKLLTGSSVLAAILYLVVALSPFNVVSLIACALCGLAVALLWPGTLVICADRYPLAGAWMFAILAAAGDIGAAFAPWLTGRVVEQSLQARSVATFAGLYNITQEQAAIRMGLLAAIIFPLAAVGIHLALLKLSPSKQRPVIKQHMKVQ
ncbi:MAG: MFS transporter [Ruminococcaceae bacterium]|jgi:fucose permease|nr:MFS transporter [Oscillospiraceae bacterium]